MTITEVPSNHVYGSSEFCLLSVIKNEGIFDQLFAYFIACFLLTFTINNN